MRKSNKKYGIIHFIITFVGKLKFLMNQLSLITAPIEGEMKEFHQIFDTVFINSTPILREVLERVKQHGGKMMRPILLLLMAKAYGKINSCSLHSAAAVEILHTASLIHDDVVDESAERRGQASVNFIYNNKIAVLVGDFLLSISLLHVSETGSSEIIGLVADLCKNLSEGEILQLSTLQTEDFSESVYYDVIRRKTATLFAICAQLGVLSVGATPEKVKNARLFGEYLGICFQIKDDIFDYTDSKEIGKPTGNDMLEGKLTLPAIYALNNFADSNVLNIAHKIKELEVSNEEIQQMVAFVKLHGGLEYAEKVMMDYQAKAKALIPEDCEENIRLALNTYLDYIVQRVK